MKDSTRNLIFLQTGLISYSFTAVQACQGKELTATFLRRPPPRSSAKKVCDWITAI